MLTTPAMCKKALSSPTTVLSLSSPLSLSLDSSSVIKVCGKNKQIRQNMSFKMSLEGFLAF